MTDAPWQMINKDKKNKVVKDEAKAAQTSFVPAKACIYVIINCKLANEETFEHLKPLASGFKKYLMGVDDMSLEDVKDILRKRLHAKHPTEFPIGTAETSVIGIATEIFYTRKTLAFASVKCI